jgi:hypothetical protein
MHIAYLDESGDLGSAGSPSQIFILSAILISHERWLEATVFLNHLRSTLQLRHGLRANAEIHAAEFLGGAKLHLGLDVRRRFQCIHLILLAILSSELLGTARVAVAKGNQGGRPLLDLAREALREEIHADLSARQPSSCGSSGLLVVMDHHGASPYRPIIPSGDPGCTTLLELPFGRRSEDSQFLQLADLLGFLTKQSIAPNHYFSASHGRRLLRLFAQIYRRPCRVLSSK